MWSAFRFPLARTVFDFLMAVMKTGGDEDLGVDALYGVARTVGLDDKELRFTDEQGYARFDRTEPGIHVVAVAERSLPEDLEVVQTGRVFVTVERGRLPDPVIFQVARPVKRKTF